jgi:hypothetical protein
LKRGSEVYTPLLADHEYKRVEKQTQQTEKILNG